MDKPKGKGPFEEHRNKWKNDVKIYFKKICLKGVHGTDLSDDRDKWRVFVNTYIQSICVKCGKFCDKVRNR